LEVDHHGLLVGRITDDVFPLGHLWSPRLCASAKEGPASAAQRRRSGTVLLPADTFVGRRLDSDKLAGAAPRGLRADVFRRATAFEDSRRSLSASTATRKRCAKR